MAFFVTDPNGGMRDGDLADIPELLDSLQSAETEHPDVSVQSEAGLSLSVFADGLAVIEDVETGDVEPQWATFERRDDLIAVIEAVSEGDIQRALAGASWRPGYGPGR